MTETLINEFRAAQSQPEDPVVDQIYQAHAATNQSELLSIIKDLQREVKSLKNKENINPNTKHTKQETAAEWSLKPWQYC